MRILIKPRGQCPISILSRLMSTVFDGGQDIGFSVDGRILKEWFFDGERLQKLKNEVKN